MKETLRYLAGVSGPSGFGSKATAEDVAQQCLGTSCSGHLTAIITGATSGIGAETARVLAKWGVRVVIPARNLKRAAEVKESIEKESPQAKIIIMEIDLSSLASVKRFCSDYLASGLPLNILINNAGQFSQKLEFSEDKVEMTSATNYLGHFLLTKLLLEKMIETAENSGVEGRIVNVSSVIHSWVKKDRFDFSKMCNPKRYNGTKAYARSKLANILHSMETASYLKARNARVTINALHPGIVKTGIMREQESFVVDSLFFVASKLLKSTSQGAATTCYVALSPQLRGVSGKYFVDCNESHCSSLANDDITARKLWNQTLTLIQKQSSDPSKI
ncbi:unnamed protein product [Rhodiola kirilowii]